MRFALAGSIAIAKSYQPWALAGRGLGVPKRSAGCPLTCRQVLSPVSSRQTPKMKSLVLFSIRAYTTLGLFGWMASAILPTEAVGKPVPTLVQVLPSVD